MQRGWSQWGLLAILSLLLLPMRTAVSQTESAPAIQTVDFARDIAPVLSRNCIACHNAKMAEGGLNLESHQALMTGGDSGAAIEAQQPEESYLLTRVLDADDPMPPADNSVGAKPLTADQVELLKRWIEAGAPASAIVAGSSMKWQAIPDELAPIYALDSSPDGHYLAVGRGNVAQIVNHTATADLAQGAVFPLIDANLKLADDTPLAASHLDLVQSLAISPDGGLLASGGYRSVKLWRRHTGGQPLLAGVSAGSRVVAVSPSGDRLAVAAAGNKLELVDIVTGQAHRFLTAHTADITALHWLGDQRLLSATADGELVLIHADNYHTQSLQIAGEQLQFQQFASLEQQLYALDQTGKLYQLRSPAGGSLAELAADSDHTITPHAVALASAATLLATAAQPEPCVIVALENQTVVRLAIAGLPETAQQLSEVKLDAPASRLQVSADGQTLLTITDQGQAKLWRLTSGELLAALDGDYNGSLRLRASQRDAQRQSGMVELLTARLPEFQKASEAELEAQKKVQTSRDEAATALATKDTELAAAQTAATETEKALAAAQQRVTELTTELETKRTAAQEAEVKRKAAETELAQREQALATAADSVRRAAERITALEQQTAREREVLTAAQSELQTLEQQSAAPAAIDGAFSQDGGLVAIAGKDCGVRLYQTHTGSPHANLTGASESCLALHTVDNNLRALTADGRVLSWNLSLPWSLEQTLGTAEESPFSDRITALDFSPDGRLLAVGSGPPSRFGEVQLVDVATASIAQNLGQVHSDTVLCLRFSPDGRQLASGGADKLCRLWQVDNGAALRSFEGHTHHVLGLAWQDNGQRLATAGADQAVKIWKAESGEQVRTISGFSHEVSAVEFVGNTPQLISVSADGTVKLINTDDGKIIRNFAGASDALYAVTISADGQQVTAGGQAGQTWTWNIEKGELRSTSQAKQ